MMMGFAGGERSNNVGDSLDFEVSQQVVFHLPSLFPHLPSGSLSLPPFSVSLSFSVLTHISPPLYLFPL